MLFGGLISIVLVTSGGLEVSLRLSFEFWFRWVVVVRVCG